MTRYETPSKFSAGGSVTPNNGNLPPRIESSDLESRMARLVGLEEEPHFAAEDSETFRESPILEPQEIKTEQPLSSNPFAKVGVVGAATFALVVCTGVFLTQIMSGNHNKPKNRVAPKTQPSPSSEPRLQQQAQEIEALKTKLALDEQAKDIKAAQEQLRNQKLPLPTQKPVASREKPTPVRTVYIQPRVVARSQPAPPPPPVAPNVEPLPTVTPTPEPDPLQEWSMLAKLGSYGQLPSSSKASASYNVATNNAPIEVKRPAIRIVDNPSPPASTVSQVPQIRGNSKSVKIGSSARGVLVTAVYGESTNNVANSQKNGNQNTNNQIFVVRLTQPLKAADGSIALPENTQILTKIRSISDRGLVQLDIVKASWQQQGNTVERSLPQDAIAIRGNHSRPLVAEQYQKGGSHVASDAKLFLLGGAGKIGDVINQPNSRIVSLPTTSVVGGTTTSSVTSVVQNDPQRNIAAAILDGGAKSAIPEITRRNQQANTRSTERSNIWYLPAGTTVELFINQDMQL
jgi:hypothetical protein